MAKVVYIKAALINDHKALRAFKRTYYLAHPCTSPPRGFRELCSRQIFMIINLSYPKLKIMFFYNVK